MFILLGSVLVFPVIGIDGGNASATEYTVREYALISFDDELNPADSVENLSADTLDTNASVNQTRRGGEMSARKLFQLKQGAQQDYQVLRNVTGDQTLGYSSTKAQSVAIVCKQCVPQKTGTT